MMMVFCPIDRKRLNEDVIRELSAAKENLSGGIRLKSYETFKMPMQTWGADLSD